MKRNQEQGEWEQRFILGDLITHVTEHLMRTDMNTVNKDKTRDINDKINQMKRKIFEYLSNGVNWKYYFL